MLISYFFIVKSLGQLMVSYTLFRLLRVYIYSNYRGCYKKKTIDRYKLYIFSNLIGHYKHLVLQIKLELFCLYYFKAKVRLYFQNICKIPYPRLFKCYHHFFLQVPHLPPRFIKKNKIIIKVILVGLQYVSTFYLLFSCMRF
jgi:hypothetical protein